MPAPSTTGQRLPWHGEYYIHGGDVVFRVENTLFRVHRYFFVRESPWFRERLPYPSPPGETAKGSSDNLPYVLEGISKTEFERFLWVFYNPQYSLYDATIDEWTSILKLAHTWGFIEVKELAIRGVESLQSQVSAFQKIVLYQTYEVDRNCLQAAYTALTVRDDPITIDEGRELGIETVVQLARAREMARAPILSGRRVGNPRFPVNLVGAELQALINDVFELPSPGAAAAATGEHAAQTAATNGNPATARDTSQTGSTHASFGSPASNPTQGTGTHANGPANGSTNGPQNGHVNGATPGLFSQSSTARVNGRGR